MKVKLKKDCNVEEHGLLGETGDTIHVSKQDAENLVKQGLAEDAEKARSQKVVGEKPTVSK